VLVQGGWVVTAIFHGFFHNVVFGRTILTYYEEGELLLNNLKKLS